VIEWKCQNRNALEFFDLVKGMVTELTKKEVIYPDSDGKPMAETDIHRNEMINLLAMLEYHYRNEPTVYVSGNIFLYYEEGNTNEKVSPDVLVALGVGRKERRTYKVWEEGKVPEVIVEVTSSSTRYEDLYAKSELYRRLGVKEYYLYDPTGDYLPEPLQAYHLKKGNYHLVPSEQGRWRSASLGLELRIEEGRLRLYDPETGERLLTPAEQAEARATAEQARAAAEAGRGREARARKAAEAEREREAQARKAAEDEVKRLRAELAKLKKNPR
jgi:Uma2 family endonuclease